MDDRYGIWSPTTRRPRRADVDRTTLAGLEPATTYRFRVVARWRNGMHAARTRGIVPHRPVAVGDRGDRRARRRRAPRRLGLGSHRSSSPPALPPGVTPGTGPGPPAPVRRPRPSVESSSPLRVNGNAIFPRMVWRQCPTYYPTSIGAGINVFLGVSCAEPDEQFDRLAGRAISTVDAKTPGHLRARPPRLAPPGRGGRLRRRRRASSRSRRATGASRSSRSPTTSRSAPRRRRTGRDIYPGFFDSADVIGFDTYPVEVRCSLAQIDNVYWMQRELVAADRAASRRSSGSRPGPMEHCSDEPGSDARRRARRDLARDRRRRPRDRLLPRLVGGGHPERGAPGEPRDPRARPGAPRAGRKATFSTESPVRVGARKYNGATLRHRGEHLDLADDAHRSRFPASAGASSACSRDGRTVTPLGDLVVDKLPGLGVAVYIVPPAGW